MRSGDAKRASGLGLDEAQTLALQAMMWTLAEPERALRLLSVTGLTPADLRARAAAPEVLGAVLGFLAAHEPDLLACAEGLGVPPARLIAAHELIEGAGA